MSNVENSGMPSNADMALLVAAREGNIMEAKKRLKKGILKSNCQEHGKRKVQELQALE